MITSVRLVDATGRAIMRCLSMPAPCPRRPPAVSSWTLPSPRRTPDLSTLITALTAGGLVATLSGAGPFTFFAPTNAAFAALSAGVLNNLLEPTNKAQLVDVLTYHVVAGAAFTKDLSDG